MEVLLYAIIRRFVLLFGARRSTVVSACFLALAPKLRHQTERLLGDVAAAGPVFHLYRGRFYLGRLTVG